MLFLFFITFWHLAFGVVILTFDLTVVEILIGEKPKNVIEFLIESFDFGEIVSDYVDTKTKSIFIVQKK